ncbi:MAG: hypothetical protein M3347_09615 [Armatimonadota bacterium]|nr:hypothetical protein [Armatimonadota bacterium]
MGISQENLFVLAVALLTWGGVFFYLWRLDQRTGELERRAEDLNHRGTEAQREKEGTTL